MAKPSEKNRAPDLSSVQRKILRQVYEILQLEETTWQPLQEFIQDYYQRVVEPAATRQLTKFAEPPVSKRQPLQYHEPDSLRSLIKRVVFAVSLLLENQRQYQQKDQPVLTRNDLETACSNCHGSGYVQHPQWKTWWDTYLQAGNNTRPFPNVKEEVLCPECGGKGTVLTVQGKILVNGLKKYMH